MSKDTPTRDELLQELEAARVRIGVLESDLAAALQDNSECPGKRNACPKSADYLRSLISTIPDLVWLKDTEGVYLACNTAFEIFFGAREAEILDKTDYDFVPKDLADFFRKHDKQAMEAGGHSINEEFLTFADNGYEGLFETIKTPMHDESGKIIGVLGIARDITDRKRFESELIDMRDRAEEASRTKSEFLANMSHEIRTPLNGIMSMLQLLKTTALDKEQTDFTSMALLSSQRLTRLLTDILDLSRIEAGKLVVENIPFRLAEPLEQTVDLFTPLASQAGIDLSMEIAPDVPDLVVGDGSRLQQILSNLVGNSLKFTKDGAVKVEAALGNTEDGKKVWVEFTVTDTGIGMPEEALESLFLPFTQVSDGYRRSHQGAGLGLSICKRLTDLMEGTISFTSSEGQGTSVRLSIPFGREA